MNYENAKLNILHYDILSILQQFNLLIKMLYKKEKEKSNNLNIRLEQVSYLHLCNLAATCVKNFIASIYISVQTKSFLHNRKKKKRETIQHFFLKTHYIHMHDDVNMQKQNINYKNRNEKIQRDEIV